MYRWYAFDFDDQRPMTIISSSGTPAIVKWVQAPMRSEWDENPSLLKPWHCKAFFKTAPNWYRVNGVLLSVGRHPRVSFVGIATLHLPDKICYPCLVGVQVT